MLSTTLAFLISLAVSAVLTPLVRNYAVRRQLVAQPRSERDMHQTAIPRLGGLAIAVGFMVPLVGIFLLDSGISRFIQRDNPEWQHYLVALFGGGVGIVALGLYDDLRGANAYQKLAVQFLIAVLVWRLGIRIDVIGIFGVRIETGLFSLPLTVLWILVVINAMNLIDGLDGLASGVAFMAILPNLVLAIHNQNVVMMVLMAALGGAIVGFLFYNYRPASIFMGDTGSMFLGFILATGSVLGNVKATATVSMIAPVLALGLPITDTLLAVFRRSMAGMPLFSADNDHLHHRLIKRGLSHRQAVLVLYGISFALAAAALLSVFIRGRGGAWLILGLAVLGGIFMRALGYLNWPRTEVRQRNRELRTHIRSMCAAIRQTDDLPSIWRALEPVRELLPVASIELEVGNECLSWNGATGAAAGLARVDLFAEADSVGEMRVAWRSPIGGAAEKIALELVGDAIGDALARIRAETSSNVIPLRRRPPNQAA